MNEATAPSQLDVRLARAKALLERGKQRQALDELWNAEALARGNSEALRQVLDFVAASGFNDSSEPSGDWRQPLSRQSIDLADLVATLERDARQASRSPVTTSAAASDGRRWPGGVQGALLATLVLGGLGAVLGAIIGFATATPCTANSGVCFSPGEWAWLLAILLGGGGAAIGLVGSLLWLLGRTAARLGSRADSTPIDRDVGSAP